MESNKHKIKFDIELFIGDTPTQSGNIYPKSTLKYICDQINTARPKITVQEMNVHEREVNHIPLWEPIKKYTMAVLDNAEIINNTLIAHCEIRLTRYGKILGILLNDTEKNIYSFTPVGYGNGEPKSPNIITTYELKYVSLDIINK